jgi:AraC-like DNA-binding protein
MNRRVQKFREVAFTLDWRAERFDFPVQVVCSVVSRWGPGDSFSREDRPTLSLSLVTAGGAEYWQEGRTGRVERGQVFLAHRAQSQRFETGEVGCLHKRSIILDGPSLDAMVAGLRLQEADVITPRDGRAMMRLFREAHRLLRDKPAGAAIEASTLGWRVLLTCADSMGAVYPSPLGQAINYISAHAHRRLTVQDIAAQAGISPRHCTRLFRTYLKCSPMAFCIRQRMAVARSLVVNTIRPFKQIAAELGFEDQFYFSTQFRQHHGLSPSALRRQGAAQEKS